MTPTNVKVKVGKVKEEEIDDDEDSLKIDDLK